MINLFVVQKGRLAQEQVEERSELLQHKPIWIDVIDPDDEELAWIKEAYGVVTGARRFRFPNTTSASMWRLA